MRENIIVNTVADAFRVVFDLVRNDCGHFRNALNDNAAIYYLRSEDVLDCYGEILDTTEDRLYPDFGRFHKVIKERFVEKK